MKAETLKKSILQYAMQGKLVAQDPNDEPASKLLKRIKAEKEQLIKDGKIKKEKPLPPITEDEISFELPKGWICERLGSILEIARGGSPRPIQDYLTNSPDGLNWIKIGDSDKGGKYINSSKEKITKEGLHKTRYVKKGDFLLSNSMSFGRPYILNIDGCIHDGWLVLSNIEKSFNKDFLYYLLSSYYIYQQFCGSVSGAVVKNLNTDKVLNAVVCIPPLAEQERIVEKLEQILPLVEEYSKNEEILSEMNKKLPKQIRQSILQYAVQGKLVPQNPNDEPASEFLKRIKAEKEQLIKDGKIKKEKPLPPITEDEIPYELPIGWSVARLNEIVNFENGDRSSNYPTEDEYVASGIPFWGAKDIINNKLQVNPGLRFINKSKFDELRSGKLKDKDFICLLRGSVGKWAEFTIDNEWTTGFINAQMVIIRLLDLVLSNWFKIYLNSPLFIEQVSKVTTGSAVAQMSAKDLSNFIILIPPLAEQQRIVTKVEELMQIVDELE